MAKPHLLALLLIVSHVTSVYAKPKTDSLLVDNKLLFADSTYLYELKITYSSHEIANFYNATGNLFAKKDSSRTAIEYYKQALKLYSEKESLKEKAICFKNLASSYFEIGQYERASLAFKEAINIQENQEDRLALSHSLLDISYFYINTYRYQDALQYLEKAERNAKGKFITELPHIYYLTGSVYHDSKSIDSALIFYHKALDAELLFQDEKEITASFNNIGVVYYEADSIETALEKFNQALDYAEKKDNRRLQSLQLNNIGNIFFRQNKLDEAENLYSASIKLKEEIGFGQGIAISKINLAQIYLNRNQLDRAEELCTSAIKLGSGSEVIGTGNLIFSKIFEKRGEKELALLHLKQYAKAQSSIIESSAGAPISELQSKYASTKKHVDLFRRELEMQELFRKYDNAIKEETIKLLENTNMQAKRKNTRALLFSAAILLLIAVIVFFVYQKRAANRKLDKRNKEIEEQNKLILQQKNEIEKHNKELEKLSVVAEKTDNAVIIMDALGNFEWVNSSFEKMFGFTVEELINNISPNIIGPGTPQYIKDNIGFAIKHKETVSYELQTNSKDRGKIWVNVTLTPILNEHLEISRLVMIDTDITSLKEAETEILQQKEEIETQKDEIENHRDRIVEQKEELEKQKEKLAGTLEKLRQAQNKLIESEKMASLGSLVAGVAHEINTPVGIGIATSSTLVEKTVEFTKKFKAKEMTVENLKHYLDTIYQSCKILLTNLNRTAELVQSFKQVSVDNMTEQKRDFKMGDYMNDIIRSLHPKYKNRPISIDIVCDSELQIKSYPGAFAQIFTNFINNSLLHGFEERQEGTIKIEFTKTQTSLVCYYSDNGKGIPEDNIKKVFDPFFTTNMQHGTGLGMNITYNLVTQKLGGEVELQSGEGKGVKFTITIPFENIQ